jgi:nitrate/TMAO reductase-like tetraheme cytochrome c subunit
VPAYFTFAPPTNDACLQCHEDSGPTSPSASSASRIRRTLRVSEETRECVDCHKWTGHFETYMEKHKEMPFSGVCVAYGCHVGTKTSDECFDCHHVLHESGEEWTTHHPQVVAERARTPVSKAATRSNQCQQCHTTGERPEFEG